MPWIVNRVVMQTGDLSVVKKVAKRFETIHTSFGWGIRLDTFMNLFGLTSSPSATAIFQLWDSDSNGNVDVLEILSGLILVSRGTFLEKVAACYDLFDFNEDRALVLDEMSILVKTSICGLCKLTDSKEPPSSTYVNIHIVRPYLHQMRI
jgi:Ca2+-binding EF-hand superfamily protein